MVKPITPIDALIGEVGSCVIESFNAKIMSCRESDGTSVFSSDGVISLINQDQPHKDLTQARAKGWKKIRKIYNAFGWLVEFKPNKNGKEIFTFRPKK